jgi:excisionase family DNA binding protein
MPLTTKEAATLLGMHEVSVYRAIKEGRLKAVRFGRKNFAIQREDLQRFVMDHPRPSRVAHVTIH